MSRLYTDNELIALTVAHLKINEDETDVYATVINLTDAETTSFVTVLEGRGDCDVLHLMAVYTSTEVPTVQTVFNETDPA